MDSFVVWFLDVFGVFGLALSDAFLDFVFSILPFFDDVEDFVLLEEENIARGVDEIGAFEVGADAEVDVAHNHAKANLFFGEFFAFFYDKSGNVDEVFDFRFLNIAEFGMRLGI